MDDPNEWPVANACISVQSRSWGVDAISELEQTIEEVVSSAWWLERHGPREIRVVRDEEEEADEALGGAYVQQQDGGTWKFAIKHQPGNRLGFEAVLHELAHIARPTAPAHGTEFLEVWRDLLVEFDEDNVDRVRDVLAADGIPL